MFDKFKNFFCSLFLKIKSLFLKLKLFIIRYSFVIFISILLFMGVFGIVIGAFGLHLEKTSAKTLDKNNVVTNGTFGYNLGNINQYGILLGPNNINNEIIALGGFPYYLKFNRDTTYVDYGWDLELGWGTVDQPFTSQMYYDILNGRKSDGTYYDTGRALYNTKVNYTDLGTTDCADLYNFNISFNNKTLSIPSQLGHFNGDNLSAYSSQFLGIPHTNDVYYVTNNTVGSLGIPAQLFYDVDRYITYGAKINGSINSLEAYNISYIDMSSMVSNLPFYLNLTTFEVHTFLFNNDSCCMVGFPVPNRYYPKQSYDKNSVTYYMNEFVYTTTYEEGYKYGKEVGRLEGFQEGSQAKLEDLTPFNAVKIMVNNLLSIKIVGDISLGLVISLCFGILLFGLIIKIFLGG